MNIFEKATKQSLRFSSKRGSLTTEDLWNLPLNSTSGIDLESVAQLAHTQLEEACGTTFTKATKKSETPTLRMEIVKHIIDVRLAEKDMRVSAAANSAEKHRLLAALDVAKAGSLAALSPEEIQKKIDALN